MTGSGGGPPDPALLRAAQALAARGWLVFPCAPGAKRPALRGNWQDLATTDAARIRTWWARAPYNIGIACGPSGLVVIDLDVPARQQRAARPASGADTLAALCERHGQRLPPTHAVGTPSGGYHLYYAAQGRRVGNSAGRLGPLIDVRADGGYVIGAGSRVSGCSYVTSDERKPAALPAWITVLLRDDPPAPAGRKPPVPGARGTTYAMAALRAETRLVATAQPGTRNDTLNRAAFNLGQLTAAGLIPPLAVVSSLASAAERAGLAGNEITRTIRSGMAAGARSPRRTFTARRPPS